MRHYKAFPVDVWVKRVMQYFYLTADVSLPKIEKYAQDKYGDLSGFAQQYLFYYARDMKGKEIVV
jgi:N-glycosylase/DNA lyase